MSKIKVLVSGCYGRMGQIVCRMIDETSDMEVLYGFDAKAKNIPDFEVFDNIDDLEQIEILPDVIIDFSRPDCTMAIADYAVGHHIPMVIATTGFSAEQRAIIKVASSETAIFMSSNMSYKIAIVRKVVQSIAPLLKDCSIEIHEKHHENKADAPSGTALMLAESINAILKNSDDIVYARTGKRQKNEIGISSERGGKIPGTHTISFYGEDESIEITHTAYSSDIFAEGALQAARFIAEKPYGIYSMDDMLK